MKLWVFAALLFQALVAQAGERKADERAGDERAGDERAATVTRVSDGDTVWLRPDDGGKPFRLRLRGIDAPERCQAWGTEAKLALAARVLEQRVRLTSRGNDDYRRVLGNIHLASGEDVSAWMVSQGHAWSYRYRRSPGPYAHEERQARALKRGLFANEKSAIEPALFRRLHGSCD